VLRKRNVQEFQFRQYLFAAQVRWLHGLCVWMGLRACGGGGGGGGAGGGGWGGGGDAAVEGGWGVFNKPARLVYSSVLISRGGRVAAHFPVFRQCKHTVLKTTPSWLVPVLFLPPLSKLTLLLFALLLLLLLPPTLLLLLPLPPKARVLLRLNRPVDVAERGLVFIQNFLTLLAAKEAAGQIKPWFKEVRRDST